MQKPLISLLLILFTLFLFLFISSNTPLGFAQTTGIRNLFALDSNIFNITYQNWHKIIPVTYSILNISRGYVVCQCNIMFEGLTYVDLTKPNDAVFDWNIRVFGFRNSSVIQELILGTTGTPCSVGGKVALIYFNVTGTINTVAKCRFYIEYQGTEVYSGFYLQDSDQNEITPYNYEDEDTVIIGRVIVPEYIPINFYAKQVRDFHRKEKINRDNP
jgi:hypothetical protein